MKKSNDHCCTKYSIIVADNSSYKIKLPVPEKFAVVEKEVKISAVEIPK